MGKYAEITKRQSIINNTETDYWNDFEANRVIPTLIDIIERLTKPVNKLKHHLGDEGDYSIARTDKQTMGWGEVMMNVYILEEIDEALKLTEE